MTKKNFIALAERLKDLRDHDDRVSAEAFEAVVDTMVSFCRSQNWKFNESIFCGYVAGTCGPSGGAVRS